MQCPRCGGKSSTSSLCSDCQATLTQAVTGVVSVSSMSGVTLGVTVAPATIARAPRVAAADGGPLEAGEAFGARYHIIRLLGAGGMGAVYHAWDAELGIAVAIKVIRPEIMADALAAAEVGRRFKRELLLARIRHFSAGFSARRCYTAAQPFSAPRRLYNAQPRRSIYAWRELLASPQSDVLVAGL